MKLRERTAGKLLRGRGESITEVLVALLISAIALLMLAGMISSSSKMLFESERNIKSYVEGENLLADQGASSLTGSVSVKDESGTLWRLTDEHGSTGIDVLYFENRTLGKMSVVSYRVK